MKNLSRLYFSFLTAVVLIMPFFLLANPEKPVKISICGLTDSAVNVEVITYPEYYIRIKRNTVNYKCKITDKQFAIDLPAYQQPVYISIYINYIKKKSVLLDLYVVEAGDSVYIQQDTDGIKFTGRSAAKFLCQYQIQNVKPKDSFLNEETTQDFYQYLKTRKIVSDTIYKIKNYILDSIRTCVSNSFYSLFKADLLNEKLQHQYILTDFVLRLISRNPLKQQQVIEYYKDNLLQQEIFKPEGSVSLISRCYIDAILSKFKLDGIMQHINYTAGHYTSSSPDFVCREIATRYSGRLK